MIGEWRSGGFQGLKDSTFYKEEAEGIILKCKLHLDYKKILEDVVEDVDGAEKSLAKSEITPAMMGLAEACYDMKEHISKNHFTTSVERCDFLKLYRYLLRQTLEVLKKDVTGGDGWVVMGGLRGQLTVESFYEKLTSIPQLRAHCKKELKRINDEINSNTNGNLERAELLFQEVSDYFETKDKDQNCRGTEPYMHSEEMRRQYLSKINEVLKIKMEHYKDTSFPLEELAKINFFKGKLHGYLEEYQECLEAYDKTLKVYESNPELLRQEENETHSHFDLITEFV